MTNVNIKVVFAIRDIEVLDIYEKAFLFTVASRGTMTSTTETAMRNMRMSRKKFYSVRDQLITKGLVTARERTGTTTAYEVNAAAVIDLARAPAEQGASGTTPPSAAPAGVIPENTPACSTGARSPAPGEHQKETEKKTEKETTKEAEPRLKLVRTNDLPLVTHQNQIRRVLFWCHRNRGEVTGLSIQDSRWSWMGSHPLPHEEFVDYLDEHRGELRELMREIPSALLPSILDKTMTYEPLLDRSSSE